MAAPVPDVKYSIDMDGGAPTESPGIGSSPEVWLNWVIAATLSLISYFFKKTIDYFFLKKEKKLPIL